MWSSLTEAARRSLEAASRWTFGSEPTEMHAPALILGLLDEPECRAACMLASHGISIEAVRQHWPGLEPRSAEAGRKALESQVCWDLLTRAGAALAEPAQRIATEHLLLALLRAGGEATAWLRTRGLDPQQLQEEISTIYGHSTEPLEVDWGAEEEERPDDGAATTVELGTNDARVLRLLDAAANRAREGLRVAEDYVRFVLDDPFLTSELKQLRHALTALIQRIPLEQRLASRDTSRDVGTAITTPSEQIRQHGQDVVRASFGRLQESLRSLEEFSKTACPELAAEFERLRYQSYTVHRTLERTDYNLKRLRGVRLYVLMDGGESTAACEATASELLEAGVDALQLRDKQLNDRELLERARCLSALARDRGALFIMNDRADLALLSNAHGVHVGQEELTAAEARRIVGADRIIGVSTHTIAQAEAAAREGADYLGVGPTFPSGTKQFETFAGLDFVREVGSRFKLPWFAIGGY